MSQADEGERHYSDKEVSALFNRAMELRETTSQLDASGFETGRGLSLAEIEQIAAEVGIEPHYLRTAAAEIDQGDAAGQYSSLLGGVVMIRLERSVQGDVSEEKWEKMVREIRRSLDTVGRTARVGKSREWTDKGIQTHVRISPRGEQTDIEITSAPGWFTVYYPLGMLAFLLSIAIMVLLPQVLDLSLLVLWAMVGGVWISLLALARSFFRSLSRKHSRRISELLNRLEIILAEPALASTEPSSSARQEESASEEEHLEL